VFAAAAVAVAHGVAVILLRRKAVAQGTVNLRARSSNRHYSDDGWCWQYLQLKKNKSSIAAMPLNRLRTFASGEKRVGE
jgi:hypothetical protein